MTAACNGAPITIGTVGLQSGVLGAAYKPAVKAISAWAASVNALGGLNCHKVKYLVADDGGDPARHQALVRQFVEQEKVIAFVYFDAPLEGEASRAYLTEKQIPVIGQEGGQEYFYDSPMHFPTYAVNSALMRLTVTAGARTTIPQGKKKLAVITCQEVAFCTLAKTVFAEEGAKQGYEVVYNASGSLTQPNFTAQCLAARNAGAQVIVGAFDAASFHRMASDCAKLTFKPTFVVSGPQADDAFRTDPNLEGAVVGMNGLPWYITASPEIQAYRAVISKFAPGEVPGAAGINGWVNAMAFQKAAQGIGPGDTPSAAGVLAGLRSFKNETLGGLTYALDFSRGAPWPRIPCGWAVVAQNGAFGGSAKMICADKA